MKEASNKRKERQRARGYLKTLLGSGFRIWGYTFKSADKSRPKFLGKRSQRRGITLGTVGYKGDFFCLRLGKGELGLLGLMSISGTRENKEEVPSVVVRPTDSPWT